jgi:hypothetical protein
MIESLRRVRAIGDFLFLGFYTGVISEGVRVSKKMKNSAYERAENIRVMAVFICTLTVAITSNTFIKKEALLKIKLGAAIIMFSRNWHIEVIT